jgi:HAD superfamily phosphatase
MKALIFDMDGVLVDVSNSYRLAIKETAKFFTKEDVSDKEIQEIKNLGGYNNDWDATEAIIEKRDEKVSTAQIIDKFQQYYKGKKFDGFIKNETWMLKKEVLEQLKKEYRLGIVTGRPREEAEFALKTSGNQEFFDVMITMDDMEEEKPNPLLLTIALEQLGCKEGYYVGDTVDDMVMAQNAGVIAIGVIPPKVDPDNAKLLKDNGAKDVLSDINKIKEVL